MWHKLPVKDRMELMKTYKKGGYSYREMVDDYNSSYKKYADGGWEQSINKYLGNPMGRSEKDSDYLPPSYNPKTKKLEYKDPIDNVRHASAGRYTQEAIEDYAKLIPGVDYIPGLPKVAGIIGSNILGLGHEASTLYDNNDDTRPMTLKLKESAADAYNNMIGSFIGASNLRPDQKLAYIKYLSEHGKIPTGQYNKKSDPMYIKNHK